MKPHGGCFTLSSISHFENIYSYRNKSSKNNACYALYSYQVKNAVCAFEQPTEAPWKQQVVPLSVKRWCLPGVCSQVLLLTSQQLELKE